MNTTKDSLGDRMKKYEYITRTHLIPRMPVIIRLDGKAFHQFCKGLKRPFDDILIKTMQDTTKYLCENVQGCVLGYTQSDEITLVLVDYKTLDNSSWFDNNIQKIVSVSASMATMAFNKFFEKNASNAILNILDYYADDYNEEDKYISAIDEKMKNKCAMFDSRVFNLPKEEVCNCVLWRQNDATRNSIEMVGQAYFSHKELHKKTCNDIQDMLMTQRGINWNDFPTHYKRGSCAIKKVDENGRSKWVLDKEIPIFKGEGRKYIEKLIYVGE